MGILIKYSYFDDCIFLKEACVIDDNRANALLICLARNIDDIFSGH